MELKLIDQQCLKRSLPVTKVPHFQTSSGLSLFPCGNPGFSEQPPNANHYLYHFYTISISIPSVSHTNPDKALIKLIIDTYLIINLSSKISIQSLSPDISNSVQCSFYPAMCLSGRVGNSMRTNQWLQDMVPFIHEGCSNGLTMAQQSNRAVALNCTIPNWTIAKTWARPPLHSGQVYLLQIPLSGNSSAQTFKGLPLPWLPNQPAWSSQHVPSSTQVGLFTTKTCFGEGNGTPLQHSCLENPMDGGVFIPFFTFMPWRRKWQPTPVFLPGESQGRGSLVGCWLWGHRELDTTEVT